MRETEIGARTVALLRVTSGAAVNDEVKYVPLARLVARPASLALGLLALAAPLPLVACPLPASLPTDVGAERLRPGRLMTSTSS